eukprot:scaffold568147_cov30-Prasinocladus_malaysianus.AAC.2
MSPQGPRSSPGPPAAAKPGEDDDKSPPRKITDGLKASDRRDQSLELGHMFVNLSFLEARAAAISRLRAPVQARRLLQRPIHSVTLVTFVTLVTGGLPADVPDKIPEKSRGGVNTADDET